MSGDPRLSIMKTVNFHQLLHTVTVNKPNDDGLPDYLVVDTDSINGLPNLIYTSKDGTRPIRVHIGSITRIQGKHTDTSVRVRYLVKSLSVISIKCSTEKFYLPSSTIE